MKMHADEFLNWKNKAITLLGMSGVGKTTLANKLPTDTWYHYSGDYRIGTKYLEEAILDNIKKEAMQVDFLRDLLRSDSIYIRSNITVHNLAPISSFLGMIGNPALGGLTIDEFKRRQRLHHDAEVHAMSDVKDFVTKSMDIYGYPHFINDAGGSVSELDDDSVMESLADSTLILYLRASPRMEQILIERAIAKPKPMYYSEDFLDEQLADYFRLNGLTSTEQMVPAEFAQWIFPRLVEYRRSRYETLADRYGYAINAEKAEKVETEADFLNLVADTLSKATPVAA